MAVYAMQTDEVSPNARCVCGDAAELHRAVREDDNDEAAPSYYDECTVQGCECRLFKASTSLEEAK